MFFVPSHIEEFFEKALNTNADALVLDMEDSVPEDKKQKVRKILTSKLRNYKFSIPVYIRVNSRESGLLKKDIEATVSSNVEGFILPMVRSADDINYLEGLLTKQEKKNNKISREFSIFPLIETAKGLMDINNIVKSSERISGLIFGHEDYLLDIQASSSNDLNNLLIPRTLVAVAARSVGCQPIDTPYLELKNLEGCRRFIKESKELGFSGMLVVHPAQIQVANDEYGPSPEEIENAKKIVSLDREAKLKGRSIAFSEGKFIAPPILKKAKFVIEKAVKIKKKNGKS